MRIQLKTGPEQRYASRSDPANGFGRATKRNPPGPLAFGLALAICSMACQPLIAAEQVSLAAVRSSPGATAQVPLTLAGVTNQPLAVALQADIVFDARSLVSASGSKGSLLPGQILASSSPISGTRRLLIYSMNNAPLTAGTLANFPFSVSFGAQGGPFPLLLTNLILANAVGGPVASSVISGSITLGLLNPVVARADGNVDVFLTAGPNQPYVLQASTNFVQWVNIFTNTSLVDILPLTDQDAHLYPYRFYRAVPASAPSGATLSGVTLASNGTVSFQLLGSSGFKFIVQGSTNLTTWVNLQTNTIGSGSATFTDPAFTAFRTRFYRLVSAP